MDKKPGEEKNLTIPLQQPILLGCLGFGFLWFALSIYSKMLGASALEIGGMFSIFSLTIALLRPFIGIASDKMGRKYFFVAGLLCSFDGYIFVSQQYHRTLCGPDCKWVRFGHDDHFGLHDGNRFSSARGMGQISRSNR